MNEPRTIRNCPYMVIQLDFTGPNIPDFTKEVFLWFTDTGDKWKVEESRNFRNTYCLKCIALPPELTLPDDSTVKIPQTPYLNHPGNRPSETFNKDGLLQRKRTEG